nr:response regulator [Angustibacter aerolatus]
MIRILVVEDEESFSDPLSYLLRKEGYDVAVAPTGPIALEEFDRSGADLVLLDLMLPGLSGTEVCRQPAQPQQRAGDHADRQGQRDRQGGRARARRRRLRDQALLEPRACWRGSRPCCAAAPSRTTWCRPASRPARCAWTSIGTSSPCRASRCRCR